MKKENPSLFGRIDLCILIISLKKANNFQTTSIERLASFIIFAINTGSDNYASANESFFHPSKAHFPKKKVFTGMS